MLCAPGRRGQQSKIEQKRKTKRRGAGLVKRSLWVGVGHEELRAGWGDPSLIVCIQNNQSGVNKGGF